MGLPVTCAHGECGTAASVAVDTGQHDAGDTDLLVEGAGKVHGVLAGQRIGHQQGFVGLHDIADGGCLGEQFLVDGRRPAVSSITTS
jgi:hypothetical protein